MLRLVINSVELRERFIRKLRSVDLSNPVEISVERWEPKAQSSRKRAYRAFLNGWADASGQSHRRLHEAMLLEFAPQDAEGILKRTGDMTHDEFEAYFQRVKAMASEYGYSG